MAKQKRDNDYYMQRLKKERPDLYRQVLDGKITVTKARQIAGLGANRSPLSDLKNAWSRASAGERADFLKWAGLAPSSSTVATGSVPLPPPRAPFDANGVMDMWVRKGIPEIMARRSMSPGDLAVELGLERLNQSVMTAVRRGTRIRTPSVIVAVEAWLAKNSSI